MAEVPESGNGHDANAPSLSNRYIMREGRYLILLAPVSIEDLGRDIGPRATTGFIESDDEPGIRKHAISGWAGRAPSTGNVLDAETYTARVQEVAREIGFHIPGNRFDNNWKPALPHQVGRVVAGHTEKKLGLWWVEKTLNYFVNTKDLSRMGELMAFKDDFPERFKRATICLDFLDEIYRITSIRITTRVVPLLAPTTRTRIEAFPGDNNGEGDSIDDDDNIDEDNDSEEGADEQPIEADSPETLRPTPSREPSDPKVPKTISPTNPPKPWKRYGSIGAKPVPTKMTVEEQLQLYGGAGPDETIEASSTAEEAQLTSHEAKSTSLQARAAYNKARAIYNKARAASHEARSASHETRSVREASVNFEDGEGTVDQPPDSDSDSSSSGDDTRYSSPTPAPRKLPSHPPPPFFKHRAEKSPVMSRARKEKPKASEPPSRAARSGLNLQRFIYGGGAVIPRTGALHKAKPKPRKGPTRAEKMRMKSTFLGAVKRAEKQAVEVASALGRTPSPVPGGVDSTPGSDGDSDDELQANIHPRFLASYGRESLLG